MRARPWLKGLLLLTAAALLAGGSGMTNRSRAAAGDSCRWRAALVEDPHPRLFDRFDAVTATTSGRAWAVGDYYTGHEGGPSGALIEEWTGQRWRRVGRPVPNAT